MRHLQAVSTDCELSLEESRHLRVKRIRKGARIILLDGEGLEAEAEYLGIKSGHGLCGIISRRYHPPPSKSITLAMGIIRPGPLALACEKAAELGANRIIPLVSQNTNRIVGGDEIERLNRIAISALKQSGRFHRMIVSAAEPMEKALSERTTAGILLAADPQGEPIDSILLGDSILLFIGPEGGFSDDERGILRENGVVSMFLSEARLRSETAAIIAVGCLKLKQFADNT